MFDSAPFTVQPWKNETYLQGHLLDNILNNHFLSEYMQWNYASFNVTLNYLMHENLEQIIIVKLLVISQTVPFTLCAARTIIFQRENLNYLIVCFTQCTLSFQKSLFSIADLFAVHYLWVVCSKDKCCVVTQCTADIHITWLVYVRTYCMPIATLDQNKWTWLLYKEGKFPQSWILFFFKLFFIQ